MCVEGAVSVSVSLYKALEIFVVVKVSHEEFRAAGEVYLPGGGGAGAGESWSTSFCSIRLLSMNSLI